jgi:pimeloyl-ACP methyl ester carboxylesterase
MVAMSSQTLTLPDGRQIAYATEGSGKPVVYFHGTASSRLEIALLKKLANDKGLRLIAIDRPGYGLSTFKDRLRLSDFAPDVSALANHLNLGTFAVLSWSGGGPFALTFTALNANRVTHAVVVGCPNLPFDPATAHNNNPLAKIAMKNPALAKLALQQFRKTILKAARDVNTYLASRSGKNMIAEWSEPDARFFRNPTWLKTMYAAMAEGFRQKTSVNAIYQEHMLFTQPCNEPLNRIPKCKVTLWQGAHDKTCPPANGEKLAQTIKGSRLEIFPTEGHCVMFAEPEKLATHLLNEE